MKNRIIMYIIMNNNYVCTFIGYRVLSLCWNSPLKINIYYPSPCRYLFDLSKLMSTKLNSYPPFPVACIQRSEFQIKHSLTCSAPKPWNHPLLYSLT